MEWKLFDGPVAGVSTRAYHSDRARARHLEDTAHRERLIRSAALAVQAGQRLSKENGGHPVTFSDLGCGDGGLLSLVDGEFARAWGYDFQPANKEGWAERGVTATDLDVFGDDWEKVEIGNVCAMTEVLEHLTAPHAALSWVRNRAAVLVCSSPWSESAAVHAPEHAWAWDEAGYSRMLKAAGWYVERHFRVGVAQVVLAR